MPKMTIDEFKTKYNEKITDNDDLLIELFEDVTDSFSSDNELETLKDEINKKEVEIAEKESEIDELKKKYKERFLTGTTESDIVKDKVEELEEKKVIDIQEI